MLAPEVEPEPELRAGRARAGVEVAATERQEALEGRRVAILRALVAGELRRGLLELTLRGEDASPACERLEDAFFDAQALLLQIPDRRACRRACDRALVRLLEAGHDPEQRRLADAVRADEPCPRLRAEREGDLIENDLGAAVLRDAGE